MSEHPEGPGWWMASDNQWYPPELHPSAQVVTHTETMTALATPATETTVRSETAQPMDSVFAELAGVATPDSAFAELAGQTAIVTQVSMEQMPEVFEPAPHPVAVLEHAAPADPFAGIGQPTADGLDALDLFTAGSTTAASTPASWTTAASTIAGDSPAPVGALTGEAVPHVVTDYPVTAVVETAHTPMAASEAPGVFAAPADVTTYVDPASYALPPQPATVVATTPAPVTEVAVPVAPAVMAAPSHGPDPVSYTTMNEYVNAARSRQIAEQMPIGAGEFMGARSKKSWWKLTR